MSNKLIKDCNECMKELQSLINGCKEWEIKKKEVLKQIENKICSVEPNKSHWAVVQEEKNKLYQACPKSPNGSCGEAQHCHKCNISWSWQTNGFGDFQWEGSSCEHSEPQNKEWLEQQGVNIPKVSGTSQTQQSQSSQSNQNKSISNNTQFTNRERERERESNSGNSKTNYLPWILGGVGVVGLIAGLVWYFTKKGGKE